MHSILKNLIAFNTISCNSNLELMDYIQSYLKDQGIDSILDYNQDKTKANLLATIGPNVEGGIVLSGHTDVVPVEGQDWKTNPFELIEKDGRYYGRGTSDMKGFVALCLELVPHIKNAPLTKPIHLAFSYDEEIGCQGAPTLVNHIAKHVPTPAFAIIGEPTLMDIVHSHKAIHCYKTTIHGTEAHSSCPHLGANAIVAASKLIAFLEQELAKSPTNEHFTPSTNTFNIGTIKGGNAVNIIANQCEFIWEVRLLPGYNGQHIIDALNQFSQTLITDKLDISTTELYSAPGLSSKHNEDVVRILMNLLPSNQCHAVAFATEAGLFEKVDIPSVVCGPGSIEQAHKPNEFVDISQLEECTTFLKKVINFACQ